MRTGMLERAALSSNYLAREEIPHIQLRDIILTRNRGITDRIGPLIHRFFYPQEKGMVNRLAASGIHRPLSALQRKSSMVLSDSVERQDRRSASVCNQKAMLVQHLQAIDFCYTKRESFTRGHAAETDVWEVSMPEVHASAIELVNGKVSIHPSF